MVDINRDLDRYLRKRKNPDAFTFSFDVSAGEPSGGEQTSWWDKMFSPKPKEAPKEKLSPSEMRRLEAMETEIKAGERRIRDVEEYEHALEEEQEEKVSLYHQVLRFFQQSHKSDDDQIETVEIDFEENENVQDDFRKLAQIQLRWLERLPRRVKEDFMNSPDYDELASIYERRGVAKRR